MFTHYCGENMCNGRRQHSSRSTREAQTEWRRRPSEPTWGYSLGNQTSAPVVRCIWSDLLQEIPRFQPFQLLQYTFPVHNLLLTNRTWHSMHRTANPMWLPRSEVWTKVKVQPHPQLVIKFNYNLNTRLKYGLLTKTDHILTWC
jgi:hypothetical protein